MPKVTIRDGINFFCDSGQTIIEAGLAAGVILEHSCLNGRCGSCVAPILAGDTTALRPELVDSTGADSEHTVLMCCRSPTTDVQLEVEGLTDFELYKPKILPCKVDNLIQLNQDVMEVVLRFPPSAKWLFNPGQYVELRNPFGVIRSYSIANRKDRDVLVLQIKRYQAGQMSGYLFEDAKVGDLLSIRGPLGTFHLRQRRTKNVVFLATGTGMAPLLSMLSLNKHRLSEQKVHVYWGGRVFDDLYFPIADIEGVDFFTPVLSREEHSSCSKGYVQDVVAEDFVSFEDVAVYACGSPHMIRDAKKLLTSRGLAEEHFFSDAFVESNLEC